jgi:hypothetical protein
LGSGRLDARSFKEDFAVLRNCLKCVSLIAALCFAQRALADQLDPLDACGALAASADEGSGMEEMVIKLSGGFSVAQAVAKCNENKDLCERVQKDLESRKIAIPKGLTCSK